MAQNLYIREWRKKRGLTQQQLADRMESEPGVALMSHATVSNIERGAQSPTLEQLNAFARALGCEISELIEHNPLIDSEVVDLMRRINDQNRPRVIAMLKAAIGE